MKQKLSIKQIAIDTLSFIAHNFFLLAVFCFCSFIASFISIKYVMGHQTAMLFWYGTFCYFFYYIFIALYYEQKPLFTSEKIVNSFLKLIIVFAFSLFMIICSHLAVKFLRYMSESLIGFPDVYAFLKKIYIFLHTGKFGQLLLYSFIVFLLTFTFFIPGFSWISSINNQDSSILTAYIKTHGNYSKIAAILICLYAVFPWLCSFLVRQNLFDLSLTNALMSILQIVFYVQLYDFFYKDPNKI